jgi:hypothetical protein
VTRLEPSDAAAHRGVHRISREFRLPIKLCRYSARRGLCWAMLATSMILARVALLPLLPIPDPEIHDEFSYLLAADTFAHGRMSNPPLAQPEFFESPHVLLTPAYASKYPPGQGLALAVGQVVFGNPYWGVVLIAGLMIFLFCWAADAWLPPQWTLIAGGLTWILFFVRHYWLTSYWGGALAACGGALVVGGLGRILNGRHGGARLSLAAGAVVLYLTRPYEGGVLCLATLGILAGHVWRLRPAEKRTFFRAVVLPNTLLLAAVAPLALWYNASVTGSALELPYMTHARQYDSVPAFWVLPPYPEKQYFSENNRAVWMWARETYDQMHRLPLSRALILQSLSIFIGGIWVQFLAFGFLLLALPWARMHQHKQWLVLLLGAWAVALAPELWTEGHYSAPFTPVHLILIVAAGRAMWYRAGSVRRRAMVLLPALILLFAPLGVSYAGAMRSRPTERGRFVRQLESKGGNHLVFVEYSKGWNFMHEWIYNGADPGASRILFAHLRSDRENRQLMEHYPGRTIWLVRLGPELKDVQVKVYADGTPFDVSSGAPASQRP